MSILAPNARPPNSPPDVQAAALAAHAAGLNVWPPKADGTKAPLAPDGWKKWQTERIGRDQVEAFYSNGRTGLGFFPGAVSGDTEAFDVDEHGLYANFKSRAVEAGLGDLVERIEDGYHEVSPRGDHLIWRCPPVGGSTKLAKRPKRPEEMDDPNDKVKTLIETRGQGGFIIIAPTYGAVNPAGAYELVSGGYESIATITPDEREALFTVARSFDEMPSRIFSEPTPTSQGWEIRPGDDFGERANWGDILGSYGWRFHHRHGDEDIWARPGKTSGWSATTNYKGSGLLYVFTSSTMFESERSYSKFAAYALLNHNGDFKEAAKALADKGYGKKAEPATRATRSGEPRSVIDVTEAELRDTGVSAIAALEKVNRIDPRLFVRGGELTRVITDEQGQSLIQALTKDGLLHELADAVQFIKYDARTKATKNIPPPDDICRYVGAHGTWPLPPLAGITEAPVLRPTGTIVTTPGYDAETMLVYRPAAGLIVPVVPESPTAEHVTAATDLLYVDLLGDFPYKDEASATHALAYLLTSVIRPAIVGATPLALINKNTPGAGATLLTEVIGIVAQGRPPGMKAVPADDTELEKRLTTALRDAESSIVFDNVDRPLEHSSLALALTATEWSGRILGRSEAARFPIRATWSANGNNVLLRGDLARRTYVCTLVAESAQPWRTQASEADFRHPDIAKWATMHRGELLAACLTLARNWYALGCPEPSTPRLGKFEAWCRVIGGVLEAAGINGFLANLDDLYASVDGEATEWEAFLTTWYSTYNAAAVAPGDLKGDLTNQKNPELNATLPSDLAAAFADPRGSFERRLGRALSKRAERRYGDDGLHLVRAGGKGRPKWAVESQKNASLRVSGSFRPSTRRNCQSYLPDISIEGAPENSPILANSHVSAADQPVPYCDGCAQPGDGTNGPLREINGYRLHDDCRLPVERLP